MRAKIDREIANHKVIVHGGPFSIGLKQDSRLLDFSSNVNPIGFPASVRNDFRNNLSLLSIYPDSNSNEVRDHIQKYMGIPKRHIVVGNGATEIIYNYCAAFLKKKKVIIPIPTFGEYESAVRLNGALPHFFKTMNLNENITELQVKALGNNCIFLCNPNNPTGVLIKRETMLKILEFAYNKSINVFLDECFIELVPSGYESVVSHLKEFDNLFILRSLTKSFGLAGIRIGYGLGNKNVVEIMNKIKVPWNVSGIAQRTAIIALADKSHLPKARRIIKKESRFLRESISKIKNYKLYNSDTNFILLKSEENSDILQKKLLKKNILIRDCQNFRGLSNKFIRIAIRTHKENIMLLDALRKL